MNRNLIFVDLDGTLIKTDILWESLFLLARNNPSKFIKVPLWLLRGKSFLKKKIADYALPDVSVLPYNEELLSFLRKSKAEGRSLILASAADERVVKKIAEYLNIFDEAFGTTENSNLKGNLKLELIKQVCNGKGFDYVGNEKADIPIWSASENAYAVTDSRALLNKIPKQSDQIHTFGLDRSFNAIIKALRPHQWVKNLLLFVPLLLAHEITSRDKIITLIIAFFSFNLCASSVYIINDVLDIGSDRHHPSKKNRPFAVGLLSIPNGLIMSICLLTACFFVSFTWLPLNFTAILILYLFTTSLYSLWIKKKLIADVIALSFLYVVRIFSGSAAVLVPISPWFLAFASFFFLNIALAKRYIELKEYEFRREKNLMARGYHVVDQQIILTAGISSGYTSVLVFYLYITNSKVVTELYPNPMWLWLIGPLLIYWLTRLWILAQRRLIDSDPVLFTLKDLSSWITGIVIVCLLILSALGL
jgi:4-hydroxybenzoate polyprenyltransferase